MIDILDFWNKNKNKRNISLPSVFYDAVLKCKGIKLSKKLKSRWTAEKNQEILAYHSAGCETQLKRVLKAYLKAKNKNSM